MYLTFTILAVGFYLGEAWKYFEVIMFVSWSIPLQLHQKHSVVGWSCSYFIPYSVSFNYVTEVGTTCSEVRTLPVRPEEAVPSLETFLQKQASHSDASGLGGFWCHNVLYISAYVSLIFVARIVAVCIYNCKSPRHV